MRSFIAILSCLTMATASVVLATGYAEAGYNAGYAGALPAGYAGVFHAGYARALPAIYAAALPAGYAGYGYAGAALPGIGTRVFAGAYDPAVAYANLPPCVLRPDRCGQNKKAYCLIHYLQSKC